MTDRGVPAGARFGPWIVGEEVGRGGTGRVFRARHVEDASLRAALKLVKPGMASPEVRAAWTLERDALARLDVPGVARLLGFGESRKHGPWIATEWVEGVPVDRAAEAAGAGFDQRLALLRTLCETLHAVHRQGVVHGDVRLENILATGEAQALRCTVVDFGLAGDGSAVDVRRDVGGLGEVIEAVLPIDRRPRGHRKDLVAILARATAADLEARYPSAHALGEELRRLAEGGVVDARRHDGRHRLLRGLRRHRALLAAVAAVVVVALGVVAVGAQAWRGARAARAVAEERRADLLLLSDVTTLQRLETRVQELPAPVPTSLGAYDGWLAEADAVLARAAALPSPVGATGEHGGLEADSSRVDVRDAAGTSEIASARWRREQAGTLGELVARFASPDPAVSPRAFVAGRRERIVVADSLSRASDVRRTWARLQRSVAGDPRFAGRVPEPTPALVPLGRHPESGLWHLWHVASGGRPKEADGGGWGGGEGRGLVFVLLPGGRTLIGAQASDPGGPRWDPAAEPDEGPVSAVELAPFYISVREMTLAQWRRTLGAGPAGGADARRDDLPVVGLSWDEARRGLARLGMRLPTEAQWEYAARGGTDTPWFTGPDPSGLADVANHRSTEAAPHSGEAPPGSYGANAYGLYDMAGNVWEWTAGVYGAYPPGTQTQPSAGFAPGTGELMTLDLGRRTIRGGGAGSLPILLRVSNRSAGARDERPASVGVRPVLPAPGG